VHLNLPFAKPLEPTEGTGDTPPAFSEKHPLAALGREGEEPFTRVTSGVLKLGTSDVERIVGILHGAERGLIVAGPVPRAEDVGPAVLALGAATRFPVLADPLSGARFGPSGRAHVVAGYDLFLRSASVRRALDPDVIVRIGGSPTSSSLLAYLVESQDRSQLVVDDGMRWKDHAATAHLYARATPGPLLRDLALGVESLRGPDSEADSAWQRRWADVESRTLAVLDHPPGEGLLEGEVLAQVARTLPSEANLLVGNSMPIRDLDAFGRPRGERVHVFGNRGASGIDGMVSTALGIRVATGRPTAAVLGDLAFYHDMNGLLAAKTLGIAVVFVVLNNDGGGIFHTLPVRDHEPAFSRFFATPHGLDFETASELYGLPFTRIDETTDLPAALSEYVALGGGPGVLEIRTQRAATHERRRRVLSAVEEALKDVASP
jgi:2-succinyl-5-enolpyruvyl-6-hydroxy-3-cyclohexene-1-carboxylate synthase